MTVIGENTISTTFRKIDIGDFAPLSKFRDQSGAAISFYSQHLSGRPIALCLLHGIDAAGAAEALTAIQERLAEFEDIGARVIAVSPMAPSANAWFAKECGIAFPVLADPNGEFAGSYGVTPGTRATLNAVLDRNGRLLKMIDAPSVKLAADGLLAACTTEAHASNSGPIDTQAPVLQIPRVQTHSNPIADEGREA